MKVDLPDSPAPSSRILYCLYCTLLFFTAFIVLYCTVLYCILLYCTVLYCLVASRLSLLICFSMSEFIRRISRSYKGIYKQILIRFINFFRQVNKKNQLAYQGRRYDFNPWVPLSVDWV